MKNIAFFITMIPCSALFTGIGIFAWNRKKPMWFYSGTEVREDEISDVKAYNRANGIMWISFSLLMWISTFMGSISGLWAGITLGGTLFLGIPGLVAAYHLIYKKYQKEKG